MDVEGAAKDQTPIFFVLLKRSFSQLSCKCSISAIKGD